MSLICSVVGLLSCQGSSFPEPPPPEANFPAGDILFQPYFLWDDQSESANGTGFLLYGTSAQNVVAVGSAHYILGEQAPLIAAFESIKSGKILFQTTEALGPVGDGNPNTSVFDEDGICEDFFFLPVTVETKENQVLQIDERDEVPVGEAVWFPNKNFNNGVGYELEVGVLIESSPERLVVRLARPVEFQSRSGTPFISQKSGKVLGILSGASNQWIDGQQQALIDLTPASCLRTGLNEQREVMPLELSAKAEYPGD